MKFQHKTFRDAYYLGILALIVYALPSIGFIKNTLYPILNWEPVAKLPLVSLIALLVALGALMGYKERRMG